MQFSEIRQQIRRLRPTLGITSLAALLVLSLVAAFRIWGKIPVGDITRDVTAVAKVPSWIGALSSLGIVLWSAAATLCFFSGAMTRKVTKPQTGRAGMRNALSLFFYCAGGLTTLFLLDDLFQIHENAPDIFGISEEAFLVIYVVLSGLLMVTFRRQIAQTDYVLLVVALGIFGLSMIIDIVPESERLREIFDGLDYLVEDGSKFMGICFWLDYFAHASAWALQADARATDIP